MKFRMIFCSCAGGFGAELCQSLLPRHHRRTPVSRTPISASHSRRCPKDCIPPSTREADLELRPTGEGVDGLVWFAVGPEKVGVNLVAATQAHKVQIENLPDGEYKGGEELQGDFGVAFYSRGRFSEGDATVEETVLFLIHPSASRQLEIHYRYPAADDSAARVEQSNRGPRRIGMTHGRRG